ncbi:MAG TPA: outer membrane beta-barrel protein [Steroidobacteraceae bacterium]|nr:outer membrane beta-barrel protein [Steroidobacteraceae bacterium]
MRKLPAMVFLALAATCASAADNGVYLGAGIAADATLDGGRYFDDLDIKNQPYKLIIGFRPLDIFGVEANYVDFGNARLDTNLPDTGVDANGKFYDAFAIGYLPLPFVDLYAKAGLVYWDSDVQLTTIAGPQPRVSDSGTDFAYGAGAQVRFGSFAARLEYERFDVQDADRVDMLTLGVTWTFF